jgi:nucleoside-diphosphate-sugar epimerase
VGDHIVRALLARSSDMQAISAIGAVVGLGGERGSADGVQWRLADLDSPELARSLRGVDAVIHVAASTDLAADLKVSARIRRERATRRIQTVVISAAAAGVARLVVVTSAMTYGASPNNEVPLPRMRVRSVTCWPSSRSFELLSRSIPAWLSPWCGRRPWSARTSTPSSLGTSRLPAC